MASISVAGDTSGSITIAAPNVAGTTTLTLPTTTGTLVVTSGAQTIEFADGSASAPSITNSGDTNTGIFFPAADTIAFAEGGTETMRLDSSGNVGIGTSSPSSYGKLSIFSSLLGSTAGDSVVNTYFVTPDGNGTSLRLYNYRLSTGSSHDTSLQKIQRRVDATDMTFIGFGSTYTNFGNGTTEHMRIDSSANLLFNSGYGSVATAYGCRAWIKFNGTGTVAINGSGNVSSITDNGTGLYTINFTTAMTDTNYSVGGFASNNDDGANESFVVSRNNTSTYTTSACQITTTENTSSVTTRTDCPLICVQIFR